MITLPKTNDSHLLHCYVTITTHLLLTMSGYHEINHSLQTNFGVIYGVLYINWSKFKYMIFAGSA